MIRQQDLYVADMIDSILLIQQYLATVSIDELERNSMLQDAVYRRFEIIGEAASQLSAEFRLRYPQIEWHLMKAMRNRMIHNYFGIQADVVFETVQKDLPMLLTKLQAVQADLNQTQQPTP